jgi:hypothetical protein
MASSVSKLDGHRQQDQVDRWLLAGKSVRWVASQLDDPPVSFQSVQRYRTNLLGPALKRVASKLSGIGAVRVATTEGGQIVERPLRDVTLEARLDERVNPFIQRSELLWQESWDAVQDAKRAVATFTDAEGKEHIKGRDFSVVAPIINAAARSLELFGRGTGYLRDDAGVRVENMMVVLPRIDDVTPAVQPSADDQVLDVAAEKA